MFEVFSAWIANIHRAWLLQLPLRLRLKRDHINVWHEIHSIRWIGLFHLLNCLFALFVTPARTRSPNSFVQSCAYFIEIWEFGCVIRSFDYNYLRLSNWIMRICMCQTTYLTQVWWIELVSGMIEACRAGRGIDIWREGGKKGENWNLGEEAERRK